MAGSGMGSSRSGVGIADLRLTRFQRRNALIAHWPAAIVPRGGED